MNACTIEIVKVGPSLLERAERFVAKEHHKIVVNRLCEFREKLEDGMSPEVWTDQDIPAVVLLSDICDILHLSEIEKDKVLGQTGKDALADMLETTYNVKEV